MNKNIRLVAIATFLSLAVAPSLFSVPPKASSSFQEKEGAKGKSSLDKKRRQQKLKAHREREMRNRLRRQNPEAAERFSFLNSWRRFITRPAARLLASVGLMRAQEDPANQAAGPIEVSDSGCESTRTINYVASCSESDGDEAAYVPGQVEEGLVFCNTPQQQGGWECGYFVISFINYIFDQAHQQNIQRLDQLQGFVQGIQLPENYLVHAADMPNVNDVRYGQNYIQNLFTGNRLLTTDWTFALNHNYPRWVHHLIRFIPGYGPLLDQYRQDWENREKLFLMPLNDRNHFSLLVIYGNTSYHLDSVQGYHRQTAIETVRAIKAAYQRTRGDAPREIVGIDSGSDDDFSLQAAGAAAAAVAAHDDVESVVSDDCDVTPQRGVTLFSRRSEVVSSHGRRFAFGYDASGFRSKKPSTSVGGEVFEDCRYVQLNCTCPFFALGKGDRLLNQGHVDECHITQLSCHNCTYSQKQCEHYEYLKNPNLLLQAAGCTCPINKIYTLRQRHAQGCPFNGRRAGTDY